MQEELLDALPEADFKVYAVFYEMVSDDAGARERVRPEELLDDPRAELFWDDDHEIGRWYERNVTKVSRGKGDRIEWDAWILYQADATDDLLSGRIGWGRTVYDTRERLRRQLEQALARH